MGNSRTSPVWNSHWKGSSMHTNTLFHDNCMLKNEHFKPVYSLRMFTFQNGFSTEAGF